MNKEMIIGALALFSTVLTVMPVMVSPANANVDVYTTPGTHNVNGRQWNTSCEKYSSNVSRCTTKIVATQIQYSGGKYKAVKGWVFNNLTYLPSPRYSWGKNPLANNGSWTAKDGRKWRTECDTAVTGRNGCRSYALATVVEANKGKFYKKSKWVFNNIVQFSSKGAPAVTTPPVVNPPTTPPSNPPASGWPNASNTGVPNGVKLTTYTGPLTIRVPDTVISGKTVNGALRIEAPGVRIVNSRINGTIDLRSPRTTNNSYSIVDSEIYIGDNLNTGLMRGNFTANRVEIKGGRRSVYCEYNCVVENSWAYGQGGDPGGKAHFSAMRMGENTTFRHNTMVCEASRGPGTGCSAALTGYGDFGPVRNNLIENNIFYGGTSSVCAYGGSSGDNGSKPYGNQARDVRFINNVFVKNSKGTCGIYGPIKSFDATRPGNKWVGNKWNDGSPVSHRG